MYAHTYVLKLKFHRTCLIMFWRTLVCITLLHYTYKCNAKALLQKKNYFYFLLCFTMLYLNALLHKAFKHNIVKRDEQLQHSRVETSTQAQAMPLDRVII